MAYTQVESEALTEKLDCAKTKVAHLTKAMAGHNRWLPTQQQVTSLTVSPSSRASLERGA